MVPDTRLRFVVAITCATLVSAAWPPGSVNRSFYHTPKGLLHYVWHGDVTATPPFVYFHAHPRSTEEFKTLTQALPETQPFVAVDYFGAGSSDECLCDEAHDEFVTYDTFAQWVLDICDSLGVKNLIPFGSLTGASGAIELAGLASKQGRVEKLILWEVYYLKPAAKTYIDNIYIPSIRHLPLYQNGSHLTFWWHKGDAGPVGPTDYKVVAKEDLVTNEQKTVDSLVNMRTGWQFKMGWSHYNDQIIPTFKQLVQANVKTLFLYGSAADYIGNLYGLDHDWSDAHIKAVIPEHLRVTSEILNGTEGALQQNATIAANFIREFMQV